jgi:hypothetical protein
MARPSSSEASKPKKKGKPPSASYDRVLGAWLTQEHRPGAGPRSVSQLSAAQLERKRQNDREAQRAIRARTKEHIEGLQRKVEEMQQPDYWPKEVARLKQRNLELEEQVAHLKAGIGLVGAQTYPRRRRQSP